METKGGIKMVCITLETKLSKLTSTVVDNVRVLGEVAVKQA